jgi:hypothetical protein
MSAGRTAFQLSCEISPIILTRGIASFMPGSSLPIVLFTQALSFVEGILGGDDVTDLDNYFAHFRPIPGSTLAQNQFGRYPFANQQVAANARIKMPLRVSLLMICPARGTMSYATKLATMTALKTAIDLHDSLGGTYTVVTPSYIYTDCVLLSLTDTSHGESSQPQNAYTWEFEQPLLTLQAAQQANNSLMALIAGNLPIREPVWSALSPTSILGNIGILPAATGLGGSQASSTSPVSAITQ